MVDDCIEMAHTHLLLVAATGLLHNSQALTTCPGKEQLFIALYYKQLSADIKIKNFKIKASLVSPAMPKARANKTRL